MNDLLNHALQYAALGWHVLPIMPCQKVPLTKHGVKDASADSDQINDWWTKWPDANIAIACGEKSGVWVIDVDVEQATNVNGYESLKEFPSLPETIKQNTPRGGFHAFYRTTNAPANRNSFRPGIDIRGNGYYVVAAPSVHPNRGQYRWDDNLAPWQIEPAEFPDFMRPASLTLPKSFTFKNAGPSAPIPPGFSAHPPADDDILQRASLYLAQCDPAIQGSAGHSALLWAAVAMVHGFLLNNSQALDLLTREYNPRCVPPWNMDDHSDAKDFKRKVTEARKLTPREGSGWLLNDPAYAPAETISAEEVKVLVENSRQIDGREKHVVNELDFLARPTGLVGEICAWINTTAIRRQPFLALACALTFCGVLFGRKIRDDMGSRTNLYCMGIARSSSGKTRILSCIRQLCLEAGCMDLLGGDDFASDSGIEGRMARLPATIFLCDEIGHLFAQAKSKANPHTAKIVPLLMKLYSASGDVFLGREYADNERQNTIIQPCCGIYGASTLERFSGGISESEMQDGWLSRCLVFHAKQKPPKTRGKSSDSVPGSIVEQVRTWFLREIKNSCQEGDITPYVQGCAVSMLPAAPEQIIVPTDLKAEGIFVALDDEATAIGKKQPQYDCLWGKAEENARKIGLILAASESFDNACITPAIADYACRLIRFLINDFCQTIIPTIVTNQIEAYKQKLLTIIAGTGENGCLLSEVTHRSRWTTRKQRMDLLSDLIEALEIVSKATDSGKGVRYWTVENFKRQQS